MINLLVHFSSLIILGKVIGIKYKHTQYCSDLFNRAVQKGEGDRDAGSTRQNLRGARILECFCLNYTAIAFIRKPLKERIFFHRHGK